MKHSPLVSKSIPLSYKSKRDIRTYYGCSDNQIIPRYFQQYIEIVCNSNNHSSVCIDEMIVPDMATQIDILHKFDMFINTYSVVNASPYLQSSLMQLLIQQDENTIEKLVQLLNEYTIITYVIEETLKNI